MTKKPSRAKRTPKQDVTPGFVRGRFAEIATLLSRSDMGERPVQLPSALNEATVAFSRDAIYIAMAAMPELASLTPDGWQSLMGLMHYCTSQGFAMALYRYADQLARVPELAAWHRRRAQGVNKGHATQSQARAAKYQRIRDTHARLEAAGEPCTYDAIAAACGCSRSTVERAINNRPTKRTKR